VEDAGDHVHLANAFRCRILNMTRLRVGEIRELAGGDAEAVLLRLQRTSGTPVP